MTLKLVEPAIYELLSALAGGQVYALQAPQNVSGDFIIFQRLDSDRWRAINGPEGIAQASFRIDSYSPSFYTSKALGAQVEEILDGYSGTVLYDIGNGEISIDIGGITLQNDSDILDQTDEPQLYRNTMTFLVTYTQ